MATFKFGNFETERDISDFDFMQTFEARCMETAAEVGKVSQEGKRSETIKAISDIFCIFRHSVWRRYIILSTASNKDQTSYQPKYKMWLKAIFYCLHKMERFNAGENVWFFCRNSLGDIPMYFLNMYLKYLTSE